MGSRHVNLTLTVKDYTEDGESLCRTVTYEGYASTSMPGPSQSLRMAGEPVSEQEMAVVRELARILVSLRDAESTGR